MVADALAKKAKCSMGSQEWSDGLPADISQLVGFDVPWTIFPFSNKFPAWLAGFSKIIIIKIMSHQ